MYLDLLIRSRAVVGAVLPAEVVLEALTGESSQAELCRKHNLSDVQLSKWKRQLLENAAPLFEPIDKQTHASQQRITQLEQLVGKLTLELDIQKKSQPC